MTVDLKVEFEFGRSRGMPKGAPSWVFRCICGSAECERTVYGPFKTRREAERSAEAFAQSIAGELSASVADGSDARH